MRIVVAYKWALNPQDASVDPAGKVDWSRANPALSEYDPVAIEMGRLVADASGAELVGLSVGGAAAASSMARKTALARGLDRTVIVSSPELEGAPPEVTAAVLAAAVKRIGDVGLVLTGDASIDVGARLTHALVAGHLGWPTLAEVSYVELDGGQIIATREADGVERLAVAGPAVLAVGAGAVQPRVPGMREVLAAGKKPVDELDLAGLGLAPPVGELRPVGRTAAAPPQRRGQILTGLTAEEAVNQLLTALRQDAVL